MGGSEAFLDLQGSSSGGYVDVDDNDATAGNSILLGSNSILGSNTPGWLVATLVPALGALGVALLAGSLVWGARRALANGAGRLATR